MNVLLVRPDGIGDEILCLPVATALRQLLPQARIIFLSSEYAAPLLQHHPDLDDIWTVTGHESLRSLIAIFRRDVDAALFLKPFKPLMWAACLARVPIRVATGYRWYSMLANRRVYEHRKECSKHEAEYNVGMLTGLGLAPSKAVPPKLVVTKGERDAARERLKDVKAPRVILHPGGFAARRWRSEHYRDLAENLQRSGLSILLTGSPEEAENFTQVFAPLPEGVRNLMGTLSLRKMMAVIAESHAVVSGATGPAHIAAACGVPSVTLFDPRRNNLPMRWQPIGTGVVLRPEVPTCERCIYDACPYWDCLDRLTVETVSHHVKQAIAASSPIRVVHV
jgi:ADP-heptose:LPS heptosyltransferase